MQNKPEGGGDLYEILGLAPDAGDDDIKQAYRSLARGHHPDLSDDAEAGERFREVTAAYAVLSDPTSRRLYDRLGWRGKGSGLAPRRGMARVYASNPRAFIEDLESVISTALGRRPEKEPTRVVGEIELDPYEAHVGATRSVSLGDPESCVACAGTGRRKVVSHAEVARFVSVEECRTCLGTGEGESADPVNVTVPPRVRHLERLPVGPEQVAIVKIVPAHERVVVRLAASAALLASIGFLLFLLAL
jgi:molecular chaperone DnaJ